MISWLTTMVVLRVMRPKQLAMLLANGIVGFHASTEAEFAAGFRQALTMSPQETLAMRRRARASARRFTEEAFTEAWVAQIGKLVEIRSSSSKR